MGSTPRDDERSIPTLDALLRVAREAAVSAGRLTLESFGGRVRAERKADGSPVTSVDRAAEAELRRIIRRTFLDHAIVGEESGSESGSSRVRWILDPIDGTTSFIHGSPLYTVLVAVEVEGRPSVGVIHAPALRETVEAATGLGCRWNGVPARVSESDRLDAATIVYSSVRALERRGLAFRRLSEATRSQRGWGDGYGFSLVATGRVDAMVDAGLKLWDIAPMVPILAEAGGRLTDWNGATTVASEDYVASNGRLHDALLDLVRPRKAASDRG
jgi:histidinol-phosphatase